MLELFIESAYLFININMNVYRVKFIQNVYLSLNKVILTYNAEKPLMQNLSLYRRLIVA